MTGGDLDCLRENRPYPPGCWEGRRILCHSKNCSDTRIHSGFMQRHHGHLGSTGRHVYLQESKVWEKFETDEGTFTYLSAIWSHI